MNPRHESTTATPRHALIAARKEAGLTQDEAAKRACMTRSHLSLVELGVSNLATDKAVALCRALGCEVGDVFGSEE